MAMPASDGDRRAYAGRAAGRTGLGAAAVEAITNILAADIGALGDVRLSANWMAACGEPGEDAACTLQCVQWASSSVRHWASRYRSARIRCR